MNLLTINYSLSDFVLLSDILKNEFSQYKLRE